MMLVNELLKLDASNRTIAIIHVKKNDEDYFKCENYDSIDDIPLETLNEKVNQFDYDCDGCSLTMTIIIELED